MDEIIFDMVENAVANGDYNLLEYARRIVDTFADTINCPCNWRDIGSRLAKKYSDNNFVYNDMMLYYYDE